MTKVSRAHSHENQILSYQAHIAGLRDQLATAYETIERLTEDYGRLLRSATRPLVVLHQEPGEYSGE